MKRKPIIISCPNCGKEYLPSEIFIPKAFFGNPLTINRDYQGKILDFDGTSIDGNETYCCDKCNKSFDIYSKISFETKINEAINFDTEYSRKLKPNFILNED